MTLKLFDTKKTGQAARKKKGIVDASDIRDVLDNEEEDDLPSDEEDVEDEG